MKVYFGKEIPQLEEPQCSVVQAEVNTGIILTASGNRYSKELDEPFILIFDTIDEAKEFGRKKVIEKPSIECSIYDHSTNLLK